MKEVDSHFVIVCCVVLLFYARISGSFLHEPSVSKVILNPKVNVFAPVFQDFLSFPVKKNLFLCY